MEGQQPQHPWWVRAGFFFTATRAGGWFYVHIAPYIDRVLMRVSRGRLSTTATVPSLILTTVGAKSGQQRITPLAYMPDGERLVLIASNGGAERHPAWYYNIRANPSVTAEIRGSAARYLAHEAVGAERAQIWQRAVAFYPGYAVYQRLAGAREIPVLVLEPQRES